MAARNPSICIDVPAELGAALDALAERRNVARAVIARTALAAVSYTHLTLPTTPYV